MAVSCSADEEREDGEQRERDPEGAEGVGLHVDSFVVVV
jgi:hypothetical protein